MGDLLKSVGLELIIYSMDSSTISHSYSPIHGPACVIIKMAFCLMHFYKGVLHSYTYLGIIKMPFNFKM